MAAIKTDFSSWKADIHILTWNVSSKYPENLSVHKLLGLENKPENDSHRPDLYVIGLQEINSQPQSVVKGLFKDDPWTQKFKELLRDRGYIAIKSEQMQGLLLILFAKRDHLLHIREVESEYTRTGLGGMWGNKGAVSIRFALYGCSVCVVNAHLAAHDHMLDERIKDYEKIVDEHKFHVKGTQEIFQHDYVFWFGDLNFRLTGETTTSPTDIKELVDRDRLDELMQKDQLSMIRRQGRAFTQLEERLPAFPPTFKFEHGTNGYDLRRRPAWCDRILYKAPRTEFKNVALVTEQTSYRSHPGFNISDHKPVTSEFTIQMVSRPHLTPEQEAIRDILRHGRQSGARSMHIDDDGNILYEQVYDDPSEKTVEFIPMQIWQINEENIVEYSLPLGFEEAGSDWIGIFKEDFASLDDYITYEYTSRSKAPSGDYPMDRVVYHLEFPNTVDLAEDERFVLLYFQSTGTRGVTGLAGMSTAFKAEKRCPSPRFDSVD